MSAESRSAQLFWMVRSLLHPGHPGELGQISVVRCDQFAGYFADIINRLRTDLESGFQLQNLDTLGT